MRALPFIAACIIAAAPALAADPHAGHGAHHEALDAAAVDHAGSLYHLGSTWTDHRGTSLKLRDFAGHPVVVVMMYGNCNTACPILVQDARRLDAALPPEAREHTRFLLVSFDSVNDTTERLEAYADARGIDDRRWHFVHGDRASVRELAMMVGVRYRDNGDGTFDHSNLITVLDGDGLIAHRVEGLMRPLDEAAAAVTAAAR